MFNKTYLTILILFCCISNSIAQNFAQRQQQYLSAFKEENSLNALSMKAFLGESLNTNIIDDVVRTLPTDKNVDFKLIHLIRILFLTNGEYDNRILPTLQQIPLWMEKGENLRVYWSENHMIMYASTAYLLKQKYNWTVDSALDNRLNHWLQLKLDYGFYEFYSTTYFSFTLMGLLNLADFAEDAVIKEKATQVAKKLLSEFLLMTNNKGSYFPACARSYFEYYDKPYGESVNTMAYLLTGFGETSNSSKNVGAFLSTSNINLDDVIASWTPKLDIKKKFGHPLSAVDSIHSEQTAMDKVIFQWSGGGYFHPAVIEESLNLMDSIGLWSHSEFSDFEFFSIFPPEISPDLAQAAASMSKSSVNMNAEVAIFKNNAAILSSLQNYWAGYAGYQQWPWAATVGKAPVYTISGKVNSDWNDRQRLTANRHLPYIEQNSNVALVMYQPNFELGILYNDFDVALYWVDSFFTETRTLGYWILGREDDSYIAIRRHCIDSINGIPACDDDGQTWVVIVGNQEMYGSFDDFEIMVDASIYKDNWRFDWETFQWIYHGEIHIDGKSIVKDWYRHPLTNPNTRDNNGDDQGVPTAIKFNDISQSINISPNPVSTQVKVSVNRQLEDANGILEVFDLNGKLVYKTIINNNIGDYFIDTDNWSAGNYIITIQSGNSKGATKIVKVN